MGNKIENEGIIETSFKNKIALVTGAGSEMGLATAQAFAKTEDSVVLSDRNENAVQTAAKRLVASGHKVIPIKCDVADEHDVAAMMQKTVSTLGQLDAAFNNVDVQSPVTEIADARGEEFDRVLSINLRGVWNCMKYELLRMRKQDFGAVVNNSSRGGLVGIAGRGMYHASKHGVLGLTKNAALEYASKGIRIDAVCPGIIETPMVTDMLEKQTDAMNEMMADVSISRLGKPEEIASAVL